MFKNLVGSKTLTQEDLKPALEKMKDHIIGINFTTEYSENFIDKLSDKRKVTFP